MKKKYVKPFTTVIGMEMEQVMASLSSYNTTGDTSDPGVDIIEGMPTEEGDGTDLTKTTSGAKGYSVWD